MTTPTSSPIPLHPQAAAFLAASAAVPKPNWSSLSPSECRRIFAGWESGFGTGPQEIMTQDTLLDGHIPVRIYRPSQDGSLPVVMYFHGGGWVLGNIDTHDTLCRRLSQHSGCVVVSVDYPLSPENKFPAALNSCYAATAHISRHARELGIDATRHCVCGDSAGGNLAAAVALKCQETGLLLHSQWLIYPVIQRNFDTDSYQNYASGHGLSKAEMEWFWDQYLATADEATNPLAAPIHATNFAGIAPAHFILATHDVLYTEGQAYAAKLKANGVPVTITTYPGMLHGFLHYTEPFTDGPRAVAELGKAMKQAIQM